MPNTSNPFRPSQQRTLGADAAERWGVSEPETMGKGWICLHRRQRDGTYGCGKGEIRPRERE
jgi:hypothetical protein